MVGIASRTSGRHENPYVERVVAHHVVLDRSSGHNRHVEVVRVDARSIREAVLPVLAQDSTHPSERGGVLEKTSNTPSSKRARCGQQSIRIQSRIKCRIQGVNTHSEGAEVGNDRLDGDLAAVVSTVVLEAGFLVEHVVVGDWHNLHRQEGP